MHTKGKWTIERDQDSINLQSLHWDIRSGYDHIARVENEANARLIAAAPILLEALRAFVTEYDNLPKEEAQGLIGRIQKLFTNARKAIAQAGKPE